MKQFEITIAGSGKTFTVIEGESILTAALKQGVMLPYSCKNGTCGSCKGLVEEGMVHYPFHPAQALAGLAAHHGELQLLAGGVHREHRAGAGACRRSLRR